MPNRELDNSDTEDFDLVFIEANTLKKLVIGRDIGDAADAVLDGKTDPFVNNTSVPNIIEGINQLGENETLRNKLGSNGYK